MADKKEYPLKITINKRLILKVVIDQHYRLNHPEMNDELILELVKTQDQRNLPIENEKNGFQYFKVEPVMHKEKPYRLVLLLCINDDFLGVINAFRVNKGKSYD
jgi:hypothetical protein